jgi:hypothetical protein
VVVVLVLVPLLVAALMTALPFADTAHHLAPKRELPSPFVWPAALSSAYV